eukprot:CAMPEP_0119537606 /NCGR_PEP_ID=MMETSP1344-20130328/50234_1 /TAXON_ID=236787 /ORGANISM="Florenciella parvula, Strain CCMP2471" /LENGTH=67 /DNA_ID=CAMNT_0007580169 /DNA_START=61 /DNA_END=261 /DNA_ORIENTATION=+
MTRRLMVVRLAVVRAGSAVREVELGRYAQDQSANTVYRILFMYQESVHQVREVSKSMTSDWTQLAFM